LFSVRLLRAGLQCLLGICLQVMYSEVRAQHFILFRQADAECHFQDAVHQGADGERVENGYGGYGELGRE